MPKERHPTPVPEAQYAILRDLLSDFRQPHRTFEFVHQVNAAGIHTLQIVCIRESRTPFLISIPVQAFAALYSAMVAIKEEIEAIESARQAPETPSPVTGAEPSVVYAGRRRVEIGEMPGSAALTRILIADGGSGPVLARAVLGPRALDVLIRELTSRQRVVAAVARPSSPELEADADHTETGAPATPPRRLPASHRRPGTPRGRTAP